MISNNTLTLVPPTLALVSEFHDCLIESYAEHKQFLQWAEPDASVASTRENMVSAISNFEQRKDELRFIVQRNSDARIVGCIGLRIRDMAVPYLEIGYWARTSEAGKGYITQAVGLLEQYAVREFKVKRLEIKMAISNHASKRVAERAGFKHEATLQSDRILPSGELDGTHVFCKVFAMY